MEVLVAAVVLLVGMAAMLNLLNVAIGNTAKVRGRDIATNVARQLTEAARSVPYSTLTPGTIEPALQDLPALENAGDGAWTIRRHGVTFTVAATVCTVDDPSDGSGAHDAGSFCAGTATGSTDTNPDDYKRLSVDVTWANRGRQEHIHQVAVINHPGSAGGPAVKTLTTASSLITTVTPSVHFDVTTSTPAASVTFAVDGEAMAGAGGSGTQWSWDWPISQLVDGTYLVTANAFDSQGLSGASRSKTMTLNRYLPAAPLGLVGGRNHGVVELEWLPDSERDVVGYRAFRGTPGGSAVLVCALTREVTCSDDSPPTGTLSYFVVADDLSPAGDYRDGPASTAITVTPDNQPPNPPTSVTATRSGDETTLHWTAPNPADPDNEPIAFYRIYRDGTATSDRYDRTGAGADVSFVDGRTDGLQHSYWVTAVDSHLAESMPVGPVTA